MLAMGLTSISFSSTAWGTINTITPGLTFVNDENAENQQLNFWVQLEEEVEEEDEEEVEDQQDNACIVTFRNPSNYAFTITTEDPDGANHEVHNTIEPHEEKSFRFTPDSNRLVIFSRNFTRNGRPHELRYTFVLKELAPNSTVSISSGEKLNTAQRVEAPNNGQDPAVRRLF